MIDFVACRWVPKKSTMPPSRTVSVSDTRKMPFGRKTAVWLSRHACRASVSSAMPSPAAWQSSTAFAVPDEVENDADPDKAGNSGLNPFQLLGLALDRMTAAGVLPAERRPGAEYLAWSAVHGLALLIIDGPLRGRPPEQTGAIALRVVEMVENGL